MLRTIRTNLSSPKAISITLITIFAIIALFARGGTTSLSENLNQPISCKEGEWFDSPYFTGDPGNCPDLIEYVFKAASVDEKNSEFLIRFSTLPSGKYGAAMRNSGWVSSSYWIDADTADFTRLTNSQGSTSQGATMRAKMSDKNALFLYPFDRYEGEIKAQAVDQISKGLIPATVIASDSTLAGWKLSFKEGGVPFEATSGKAIYEDGIITIYWGLNRANVVFFAVFILLTLMIIALGSAYALTRSVGRGRRPPSMNLLLWIATVLFAILQVRTNFPGNPPIGILLDFAIVFPVLGLLLILGIVNTVYWLRRTDWDYENEPTMEENLA